MPTPAPSLEIRAAAPEDAAKIRDLTRAAYAKWAALIGREPQPMQADYDRAVREHSIDLLTVDGALVGLIETIVRPDHLWIENVAVAPDCQGRGYGRLLLAHAETHAVKAERGEIRLLTNAAFAANLALYAKLGYAIEAASGRGLWGSGSSATRLRRRGSGSPARRRDSAASSGSTSRRIA